MTAVCPAAEGSSRFFRHSLNAFVQRRTLLALYIFTIESKALSRKTQTHLALERAEPILRRLGVDHLKNALTGEGGYSLLIKR